jgi:hypothetical protein
MGLMKKLVLGVSVGGGAGLLVYLLSRFTGGL